MAAILNFSKTLRKTPAEFLRTQIFLELPSGGHFEFW